MKRSQLLLLFFITLLIFPAVAHAQAWAGIIDPNRAIDWTQAGVPGGIPSGSWTQCGSTIAAYTGTGAPITNAISGCGTNQYVLLGPGTFTLSTGIEFGHKSKVVLRGSGANSTFLVFTGGGGTGNCNTGLTQAIGICGPDSTIINSPPAQIYDWSAGYAKGTNQITLSSTASITKVGSGSPTLLMLNQDDDGYTGYPASGSSRDNGGYWVCADHISAGALGCSDNGPDGALTSPLNNRWQYEIAVATAINGKVVTIQPPLKHPNWRTSQAPKVWLLQTMQFSGVENLSVDLSGVGTNMAVAIWGCYGCWVSGIRVINFGTYAMDIFSSAHVTVQNNYLFNGRGPDSYGIRTSGASDDLIMNNIFQAIRSPSVFDFWESGSVIAYNFAENDTTANSAPANMFPAFWDHAAGDDFHLFEGNISPGFAIDGIHGTHLNETTFRNFSTGWESCANGQCGSTTAKDFGTTAITYRNANRYGNIIGNVSGTPGYHTSYLTQATQSSGNAQTVYALGAGNAATSPPLASDPLVYSTTLVWANYDNVTDTVRFCGNSSDTEWSTTCTSKSEVPTGALAYPNRVPTVGDTGAGQPALPASFFLSSKPSWFGSLPWPPIGPDVSGGNIGQCSGTLNTVGHYSGVPATSSSQCTGTSLTTPAWGGHVNTNPAMNCALNVMGMPPDGSGGALSFNASACYGGSSSSQAPNPPTNLIGVVSPN